MPPGCSATRPEAADFGRTSPVHAKRACKNGEVGELDIADNETSGLGRYADPPFEAGFAFSGFWCRGLAQWSRARGAFRAPRQRASRCCAQQAERHKEATPAPCWGRLVARAAIISVDPRFIGFSDRTPPGFPVGAGATAWDLPELTGQTTAVRISVVAAERHWIWLHHTLGLPLRETLEETILSSKPPEIRGTSETSLPGSPAPRLRPCRMIRLQQPNHTLTVYTAPATLFTRLGELFGVVGADMPAERLARELAARLTAICRCQPRRRSMSRSDHLSSSIQLNRSLPTGPPSQDVDGKHKGCGNCDQQADLLRKKSFPENDERMGARGYVHGDQPGIGIDTAWRGSVVDRHPPWRKGKERQANTGRLRTRYPPGLPPAAGFELMADQILVRAFGRDPPAR